MLRPFLSCFCPLPCGESVVSGDVHQMSGVVQSKYADVVAAADLEAVDAAGVTIVHRQHELTARNEFLDKVRTLSNVEFRGGTTVEHIASSGRLERIDVREAETGALHSIETDFLLIRIGVEPNSELVAGSVAFDDAGYIRSTITAQQPEKASTRSVTSPAHCHPLQARPSERAQQPQKTASYKLCFS